MKKDGFEEWYFDTYEKKRTRWLPTLDSIGMENAERQFVYWEAMNKKAGEDLSNPGTQVNILNNMKVDFIES